MTKQKLPYSFTIPIGDWSGDGHSQCEYFLFKSNKPVEEVREAYFNARRKFKNLSPESFCNDYQDSEIPEELIKEANTLGFKIDPDNFFHDELAEYVAWFCCLGDHDLVLEKQANTNESMLVFYGYDHKKRHIGGFGYGMFE